MKPMAKFRKEHVLPNTRIKLRTKKRIADKEECRGFLVHERHLDARKPNTNGEYQGWVPGAGGDVWWVKHEDGTIGAYMYDELTDV